MKPSVVPLLALMLVGLGAGTALAHPDMLGVPDPYWQQVANAAATPARPVAAPLLLEVLIYASGGLCVLLLLSLLLPYLGARRDSGARANRAPAS